VRRLSTRLLASHVVVALVGAVVTFLVVRFAGAAIFEQHVVGMSGMMRGQGAGQGELRDTFVSAVNTAMVVGTVVSVLVAGGAAYLLAQRLLRPVEDVRVAAQRIARGDYGHRVPVPVEAELAALAADVNALGSALEDTETRRVRLLGDIAHELRTPLTVMEGQIEGMIDGVFEPTPESLADLEVEVERMRRLTGDLGDLSRLEEGSLSIESQPVDLREVADSAVSRFREQLTAAGVVVTESVGDRPAVVTGDEARLVQVVSNLVTNARRAMPEGGRLTVTVEEGPESSRLRVSDTGVGLAAEDVERVFDRFYRAAGGPSGSAGDGGSGIGLTVSRGIVRAMGGDLTAASGGPGQGAVFTVTLPRGRSAQSV
jgi:signal transduction histidine kinase